MKKCQVTFEEIISLENLAEAWQEFVREKRGKRDVQEFALNLGDELLKLHDELEDGVYRHGGYTHFAINDPKPRSIHKATVRDRLLHHAIHRKVYPYFAARFIADSFSCQTDKGLHRAIDRFRSFGRKVSKNSRRTCWVLKCDIRKFFASVNHSVLLRILQTKIADRQLFRLLENVIESFSSADGKGIPLGNLTSQLFSNIYMDEFDQFVKHELRIKNYIRYADDFVFLSPTRSDLLGVLPLIQRMLTDRLVLTLHPNKITLETLESGVDFLGWIHSPHHRIIRTKTRRRILGRTRHSPKDETVQSYLGLLQHGDAYELRQKIMNDIWVTRVIL